MNGLVSSAKRLLDPTPIITAFEKDGAFPISFPSSKEESFRKFPIAQLDWEELGYTQTHKVKEKTGETWNANDLAVFQKAMPLHFFSYHSVSAVPSIEYYQLEADQNLVYELSLAEKPSTLVRFFYVPKHTELSLSLIGKSDSVGNLHSASVLDIFFVDQEAKLVILDEVSLDPDMVYFRSIGLYAARDAKITLHHFPFGGFRTKCFVKGYLSGEGSEIEVDGVSTLNQRNLRDLEMVMEHGANHTRSRISYRGIVQDRAHNTFTGNLIIPSGLKKITAHQESFNLSLSKKARAEANPKLEVFAEDVSCTHGATVGDLDEEQFFYLLARGLPADEAKKLLLLAFYGETVDRLRFTEDEKERLRQKMEDTLLRGNV